MVDKRTPQELPADEPMTDLQPSYARKRRKCHLAKTTKAEAAKRVEAL
jgi:hypothetical protein